MLYTLSQIPPAANNAAAPKPPVAIGIAAALLDEVAPLAVEAGATEGAIPNVVEGAGIPDVRGFSEALEAPEKAGIPPEAVGLEIACVAFGFKTLLVISSRLYRTHQIVSLINDMNNPVCNQYVGDDDFGAVDEYIAIIYRNSQITPIHGFEACPIFERGAVAESPIYNCGRSYSKRWVNFDSLTYHDTLESLSIALLTRKEVQIQCSEMLRCWVRTQ